MSIYKLTVRPLSSFRTPLQSDTIFGHLMWALRYREGEAMLVEFLDRYRKGRPPLLVSAGFPGGTLPMPVLPGGQRESEEQDGEEQAGRCIADEVVSHMLGAALEDTRYLPLAQWRRLARGLTATTLRNLRDEARWELQRLKETASLEVVTRTAVDRITGSGREGRLFMSEATFYGSRRTFDIWHKVLDEEDGVVERLTEWWRLIERNGFGSGKSSGHGALRIQDDEGVLVEAGADLPQVDEPNGFVTLSAWVPKRGDPTNVSYRTRVKRGKLGEGLALPSPWKKPICMLEPGAVARLGDGEAVREWYGGLIEDVHWSHQEVVQYGYAFPLGVRNKEVSR